MSEKPTNASRSLFVALAVAVVLMLVAFVVVISLRRPPVPEPEQDQLPVTAELPEIIVPEAAIIRIQLPADKHPLLHWSITPSPEVPIDHFLVEVVDEDGYGTPVSPDLPSDARSWQDTRSLSDGDRIIYSVVAVGPQDARSYSVERIFVFRDGPVPPTPVGLQATWSTLQGRPFVRLSWEPATEDDRLTQLYFVQTSIGGPARMIMLPRRPESDPSPSVDVEMTAQDTAVFSVSVVAATETLQESAPVTLQVESPVQFPPTPGSVRADFDAPPGSPVSVAWDYPAEAAAGLLGFRLYESELLVADESLLKADARTYADQTLLAGATYQYAVAAVSRDGVLSARGIAQEFTLPANHVPLRIDPPSGVVAEWVETENGLAIRLHWDAPAMPPETLDGFVIEQGEGEPGTFSAVNDQPWRETDYRFVPEDRARAHAFKVYTISTDGQRSEPAEGYAPAPAEYLQPARLSDYRVFDLGENERLEWVWRYPESIFLGGFRIYQNGERVADESTLDAQTRSWMTGVLERGTVYEFEIEAVGRDGRTAIRGAARSYEPM